MCPNQLKDKSILPDCQITNRVFMYSFLQTLLAEDTRGEEVHVQLRDRYEVFRQLLSNYPMPLLQGSEENFHSDLERELGNAGLARDQDTGNQGSSVSSMHTNMGNEILSLSLDSVNLNEEASSAPRDENFEETLRHFLEAVRPDH
ncbi:uncharacterized protein [Drosophila tropicalis]|uniref:uncharacterized protein n=1 Tax=Drosophila tropicalis TaxID=46794 RepID=UPI0035AC2134